MLRRPYFPFGRRSKIGQLVEAALSSLMLDRAGVLVPALRFMHRSMADPDEMAELVSRIDRGLDGITPIGVYRYAAGQLFSAGLPGLVWLTKGYGTALARRARWGPERP
jgi:hypothetical protein